MYTGKVYIRLNGSLVESMQGATLNNPTGGKRTPVVGNDVYGWAESVVAPTIEFDIAHGPDVDTDDLWAFVDGNMTFECDSGPTYICAPATMQEITSLKTDDGGAKLSCIVGAKRATLQK